jgi:hypothetical protein
MTLRYTLTIFASACLAISSAGCSSDKATSEVGAKNDRNIKRVANLYAGFQALHGWQGPKDESALADFAKHGLPDQSLKMMNIDRDKIAELFTSERDKQKFQIRYGVSGGPGAIEALVFEKDGLNGKKMVAFNGGLVEETDGPRYAELWEGRGGGPAGELVNKRPAGAPTVGPTVNPMDQKK